MLVAPVARVIASVVVFTLASNCATNMMQTVEVRKLAVADGSSCPPELLDNPPSSPQGNERSLADRLKGMNRRELLQVFANGRAPTAEEMGEWFSCQSEGNEYCEWDAMLLDNNSIVMNASSKFFTYQLFGGTLLPWRLLGEASRAKGRWNGKAFAKPTTLTTGKGINRFSGRESNFRRHEFDYDVVRSAVLQNEDSLALRLDYWRYQSLPISPWWSMHDEVRVINSPNSSKKDDESIVLIGMGWMGWSGGALNCSPFILERSSN